MYTFEIMTDWHDGKYPLRTSNFKQNYDIDTISIGETSKDPEWMDKFKSKKINLNPYIFLFLLLCVWAKY